MPRELSLVSSTPRCKVAAARGLVVGHFWQETTSAEADALGEALRIATRAERRVALLVVIGEDASAPDGPTRTKVGDTLAAHSAELVAFAGVVIGAGLVARVKRTMMRLILTLGRLRCPIAVESNLREAVGFFVKHLSHVPVDVEPHDLISFFEIALQPSSDAKAAPLS